MTHKFVLCFGQLHLASPVQVAAFQRQSEKTERLQREAATAITAILHPPHGPARSHMDSRTVRCHNRTLNDVIHACPHLDAAAINQLCQ